MDKDVAITKELPAKRCKLKFGVKGTITGGPEFAVLLEALPEGTFSPWDKVQLSKKTLSDFWKSSNIVLEGGG
jgi:hypothetical protein